MTPLPRELVLLPEADTYISRRAPMFNFGERKTIRVDNNPASRGLLTFWIPNLDGREIEHAVLRLYITEESHRGFSVREVEDIFWNEMTVDYYSAPARGEIIARSDRMDESEWISVDLTSYVISRGEGSLNLAIYASSSNGFSFTSKEAGDRAPQLAIFLAP